MDFSKSEGNRKFALLNIIPLALAETFGFSVDMLTMGGLKWAICYNCFF